MPTTPLYGLPWPLSTATPDVPRDVQALAEATETAIATATSAHARGTFPSQSIPNGAITQLSVTVASSDKITQAAGVFTLPEAGFYTASAAVSFGATASGTHAFVEVEGVGAFYRYFFRDPETAQAASATFYSPAAGTCRFRVYQSSGQARNATGTFAITYLGA